VDFAEPRGFPADDWQQKISNGIFGTVADGQKQAETQMPQRFERFRP
jgi:hypothetical protein